MACPGPAWLVVGLGNPGARYQATRHNVGFTVCDLLARRWGAPPWRGACRSRVSAARWEGRDVLLAEPETYMNRSGEAVGELVARTGVELGRVLIVHDDLDLPFGRLRIRTGGGAGGHNGLRSILETLGTGEFLRLKVGIGRPQEPAGVVEHVLSPFSPGEQAQLPAVIERAALAAESIIVEGPSRAMHRYHT